MRAVVCRVASASVVADGVGTGRIGPGLLVYLGVLAGDTEREADWLADKLAAIRLFNDDDGKINRSVVDIDVDGPGSGGGGVLLIPNFTLAGRTQKGTRPSFSDAAAPNDARRLFEYIAARLGERIAVATGVFGAHMVVESQADGPVTVVIDTPS